MTKPMETTDHPSVTRLQIERYRQMTGEQRLEIGLGMWEFAREFIACSIRNDRPNVGESELGELIAQRMGQ